MWTAWLGTPIHELSHAVMCVLFRHQIKEMALFEPDQQSECLGYVRHAYRAGHWFDELGNVFIGIAPLLGGTASILFLLRVFYPSIWPEIWQVHSDATLAEFGTLFFGLFQSIVTGIFEWRQIGTFRFWLFLYLVLCVGSHMAPSFSDYQGAMRGSLIVIGGLALASLIISCFTTSANTVQQSIMPIAVPVASLLAIVLILCVVATAIVFAMTEIYDYFTAS